MGCFPSAFRRVTLRRMLKQHAKRLNYLHLSYTYFVGSSLLFSLVLWLMERGTVAYIDALFLSVSGMTVTGLSPVNSSALSTPSHVLLFFTMIVGSNVFTSLIPVWIRRRALLEYNTKNEADRDNLANSEDGVEDHTFRLAEFGLTTMRRRDWRDRTIGTGGPLVQSPSSILGKSRPEAPAKPKEPNSVPCVGGPEKKPLPPLNYDVVDSDVSKSNMRTNADTVRSLGQVRFATKHGEPEGTSAGLDFSAQFVTANTATSNATSSDPLVPVPRPELSHGSLYALEEVVGVEFLALTKLQKIVLLLFLAVQLMVAIIVRITLAASPETAAVLDRHSVDLWFFSAHISVSAFNNAGFTLLDDSLDSFSGSGIIIFTLAFSILVGFTAWPIAMRLVLHLLAMYHQRRGNVHEKRVYQYLLDHPRRCYTHLFEWHQTRWLCFVITILTSSQLILALVMDWNAPYAAGMGAFTKIADEFFQSCSTRLAGLTVIPVPESSSSVLFLYLIMMYIGVYPVVVNIRETNVARKRVNELGLRRFPTSDFSDLPMQRFQTGDSLALSRFRTMDSTMTEMRHKVPSGSYIMAQSKELFWEQIAWPIVGLLLVLIVQDVDGAGKEEGYAIFDYLFEVISAYGTVGLTLGVTSRLHVISKLVIMCLMLIGRHRGMPEAFDVTVRIPSKHTGVEAKRVIDLQTGNAVDGAQWVDDVTSPAEETLGQPDLVGSGAIAGSGFGPATYSADEGVGPLPVIDRTVRHLPRVRKDSQKSMGGVALRRFYTGTNQGGSGNFFNLGLPRTRTQ
ncbi:cation transport protein-domain-containing protein [Powellomyces hirtus]|nr:cation transport protein-domain-containing protein [Powellomyces hirtus]